MTWYEVSAQLILALIMMTKIKKWIRHSSYFQPNIVVKTIYMITELILHFCINSSAD